MFLVESVRESQKEHWAMWDKFGQTEQIENEGWNGGQ